MELLREVPEARRAVDGVRRGGRTLGMVPTMGCLHAGHQALIREAVASCDEVVVTLFVNPTQFGPQEDYGRYPRDLERDAALCEAAGARWLFAPSAEAMYPGGTAASATRVVPPPGLTTGLCGAFRDGHFTGVATVVAKLFALWQPDRAWFGLKDFQQTAVIRSLVRDLLFPVSIELVPTVREPDGLAMSSRNAYLEAGDRERAGALPQALQRAWEAARLPGATLTTVLGAARGRLAEAEGVAMQYLELVNRDTLAPVASLDEPCVLAVAAHVGNTRLIDNILLHGPSPLGVTPLEGVAS